MSDERLKMPPERDFGFYQRRKHDKWRAVPAPDPALEAPVADSHAHVHLLPDPGWELARCAANGVDFVCMIVDPSEDGEGPFEELGRWEREASGSGGCPTVRIATGVHPHNAKSYDDAMERRLVEHLSDPRVVALGEVGLDFHYDFSPRDVQREVFRRQIRLAIDLDMPLALHLRGGDDPKRDNAHEQAFAMLEAEGALGPRTLLHCCALPPDELKPWIEAGCYIAYGGAITFKKADAARDGGRLVPADRLVLETDSPYMTPEPMRGSACTPAHVIFNAAALAQVRGISPGPERAAFLEQLHANTINFFRCDKVSDPLSHHNLGG